MSNRLGGKQGTAYLGTNANQPPNWVFADRDPTTSDINYSLGDIWLNTIPPSKWVLVSLDGTATSKGALATWVPWGAAGAGLLTLTGTAGGPVTGDALDNINIVSTIPGLAINGNPATNTLSLDAAGGGGLVTFIQGDAGAAVAPDAGGIVHIESTIPSLTLTSVGAPANTLNLQFTGILPNTIMQSLSGSAGVPVYPDNAGNIQIDSTIPSLVVAEDPGNHKLTLTFTGIFPGFFTWYVIPGAAQAIARSSGYIANNAVQTVFTLPAVAVLGDTFAVTGMNNDNGWRIAQNAGQAIYFGEVQTTAGIGGYLQCTRTRDIVYIVCTVANTDFQVINSIGNITVV